MQDRTTSSISVVIGAAVIAVIALVAFGYYRFSSLALSANATSASADFGSERDAGAEGGADAAVDAGPPLPTGEFDPLSDAVAASLDEQRAQLLTIMKPGLALSDAQVKELRSLFAASKLAGQGNPKVTEHPLTRSECRARREKAGLKLTADPEATRICGAPWMVPLYDRAGGAKPESAPACIDQFEFPGLPCEYPVVYATAREAALMCRAVGKRMCDAHEWEGGCAGTLRSAAEEYLWGSRDDRHVHHQYMHNKDRPIRWAYGEKKDHSKCGTMSRKSEDCVSSEYEKCGSNTYPAGSFAECVSPLGVYDQHGNAAEHMNLPIRSAEQLMSRGGSGITEMKGSWFIFGSYEAHLDDCRWRAPDWHGGEVMSPNSHRNFHLGFRCCKNVGEQAPAPSAEGKPTEPAGVADSSSDGG